MDLVSANADKPWVNAFMSKGPRTSATFETMAEDRASVRLVPGVALIANGATKMKSPRRPVMFLRLMTSQS